MNRSRRQVLKSGGGVTLLALVAAAGWLKPGDASAQSWNKAAFDTKHKGTADAVIDYRKSH